MNYNLYTEAVRERGRFPTYGYAEKAIHAVLDVLGRHISIGQARDLAAAVPIEFRNDLRQTITGGAEAFGLDEFLARVAEREAVSVRTAAEHARAVLSVLAESVPKDELVDTLEQIPKDIRTLFGTLGKAA